MKRPTRSGSHRIGRVVGGGVAAAVLVLTQANGAQAHDRRDEDHASFDDQRVVELTTRDGATKGRAGLAFHHTRADDVTATNAAVAYTSCDGCRAVALSFQVVVADGGPTNLNVGNLALAMNENCTGCESVAVAFQVVLASDRRLSLTSEGRRQLTNLRFQLRALSRSDAPVADIVSQSQGLMADVADVLATELKVRAKVRCDKDIERHPGRGIRPDGTKVHDGSTPDTGDSSPADDPQQDPATFS